MKYPHGQEVRLGDRVRLGTDDGGIVVASIDGRDYSEGYSEAQSGYLQKGVMIEFPSNGLVHYEEPEPGLQLVERAKFC